MKGCNAMHSDRRRVLQSAGASLVPWALPLEARAADAVKLMLHDGIAEAAVE